MVGQSASMTTAAYLKLVIFQFTLESLRADGEGSEGMTWSSRPSME